MALVDLHTHSTASDGTETPTRLLERAADLGLAAVAITDHDTVGGLDEAADAAERVGVELVCGIEISAVHPRPGEGEMHVLGLFIDPHSESLRRMNEMLIAAREERNEKMLARLDEIGTPIDRGELASISHGLVSRAHMAELLVKHGHASSIRQAFDRLIGPGGAAWFDKARLTYTQAFATIHDAGGLTALAHPVHYEGSHPSQLATMVGRMADAGLDALEAFHPDQTPAQSHRIRKLADRFGLCVTGGSDFHGPQRMNRPLNSQRVDETYLAKLKERLAGQECQMPNAK